MARRRKRFDSGLREEHSKVDAIKCPASGIIRGAAKNAVSLNLPHPPDREKESWRGRFGTCLNSKSYAL